MSTSKYFDRICVVVVVLSLIMTVLFMNGANLGIDAQANTMAYETGLFDTSYVHEVDIVMNDWDSFIETCENEEYAAATVVIDGNKMGNIAIRAKGNTSLSSVKSMDSERYSFKLEFDHYEKGKTYQGLDQLCLNNLIQDNTMMKDYLTYQMMSDFGVDSPLCSYAYVTVNGADWGLYLAVESVQDSFLTRNYGSEAGELYKPDSMSMGAGPGNGKDFRMSEFDLENFGKENTGESGSRGQNGFPQPPEGGDFKPPEEGTFENFDPENFNFEGFDPENLDPESIDAEGSDPQALSSQAEDKSQSGARPEMPDGAKTRKGGFPGGGFGGMGSTDVKLQYIDEDPDSYSNIFNNANDDLSDSDKNRLIASLKNLSEYTNLEETLDTEEVLRYFVVHNFVVNGDSYTGAMIHNYYLYESDGQLSMIPWDYNLAFGTFQGNNASDAVNNSIDNPVSGGDLDDRPMVGWIFSDATYTNQYHELFNEFIARWFTDGELARRIAETAELIRPYVEKDPTKFCTTDEFEAGVDALTAFVELRAESVRRQLSGDTTAVDAGDLNLSDMGSMNRGNDSRGGGFGGGFGGSSGDDSETGDRSGSLGKVTKEQFLENN